MHADITGSTIWIFFPADPVEPIVDLLIPCQNFYWPRGKNE